MKILILRYSSIGDIVLTSPVVRCLRHQIANVMIHYATKKQYVPLLEANPNIDKIHILEGSLSPHIKELKSEKFDQVIDLHSSLRTRWIRLNMRKPWYRLDKQNDQKRRQVRKLRKEPITHIVQRYLSTVEPLNCIDDGLGLDYYTPKQTELPPKIASWSKGNPFIILVTGAKFQTKQIPVQKAIDIIRGLSYPVLLIGSSDDRERGRMIVSGCPDCDIYNACGELCLNQSAKAIHASALVITPDTGMMHIAAAFKKPLISIWGSTSPIFGMNPYYGMGGNRPKINQMIQVNDLACRPCSKLGFNECPKGHFNCMNKIDHESINKIVNSLPNVT